MNPAANIERNIDLFFCHLADTFIQSDSQSNLPTYLCIGGLNQDQLCLLAHNEHNNMDRGMVVGGADPRSGVRYPPYLQSSLLMVRVEAVTL